MKYLTIVAFFLMILVINKLSYAAENEVAGYVVSNYTGKTGNSSFEIEALETKGEDILPLYAGLSFNVNHFSLVFNGYPFENPNFNIRMTKQYGVTLYEEGPHIELLDWKTCDGTTVMLKKNGNTYTYQNKEQEDEKPCSIEFEVNELKEPLEKYFKGDQENVNRWIAAAGRCDGKPNDCVNLIAYHFEVVAKGNAPSTKPFKIILPIGC